MILFEIELSEQLNFKAPVCVKVLIWPDIVTTESNP
jgi:hypothetical protein